MYAIYEPSAFNWRTLAACVTEGNSRDEVIASATSYYAENLTEEEGTSKSVWLVTYDKDGNETDKSLIDLEWEHEGDYSGESVWNKAQSGVR